MTNHRRSYVYVGLAGETAPGRPVKSGLYRIAAGDDSWEDMVPDEVAALIKRRGFFGYVKPDARDYAAERKVVEKVHDLVDQFRELGPQFRVVVLDVEEEGFDNKLAHETENEPELRAAIDSATENSIFFHAKGTNRVQRLSFNEFYQLEKTASKDANPGSDGKARAMRKHAMQGCGCASACGVHGHDHARAWSGRLPVSDLRSFWGALGCACWAV